MKSRTIRSIFFSSFSGIVLTSIACIFVLFSLIQAPKVKQQTAAALTQSAASISTSMDTEISRMSTIAMDIAYSTQVSSSFVGVDAYSKAEADRRILSLLTMQIFPDRPVDQVDLYTADGQVIASGLRNEVYSGEASARPWFTELTASGKNQAHMFTGQDPYISKYYTEEYGKYFVSFAMQIYNTFNLPYGYVEIRKRLSRVLGSAMSYNSVFGEEVFIFDQNGSQMYPLHKDGDAIFAAAQALNFPTALSSFERCDTYDRMVCSSCKNGDYRVILAISSRSLSQPVRSFLFSTSLVAVLTMLFALAASYYTARKITVPLNTFCQQLKDSSLSLQEPLGSSETNVEEIQTLYRVFSKMRQRLQDSTSRQIQLEKQEMQSRMLALQSQMNPHLLYNSLATIQAMSDEGLNADISVMCQSISNILRYISSDAQQEVALKDEIQHTRDYIQCMAFRYQEDLACSIHIPEEMDALRVPKLCVQLLVENAIKYAALKRPPYCISIEGLLQDDRFEISIRDNGPGFSQEALQNLESQIEQINRTGILPSLEINGMGILNVYIRFRLLHGEQTIFRLENLKSGGACVTMGVKQSG